MKMNLRLVAVLSVVMTTAFTSCKKDYTPAPDPDPTPEVQAHADDQNRVSANLDQSMLEVNAALQLSSTFSGRVQNSQNINSLCNITAAMDTANATRKITLTYNGADCFGTHLRTGTIVISTTSGTKWKDAGAVVTVTFQNFKVKRVSDNKSLTFNGTQTFTNVSGGLLGNLASLQSITHTIISNNMSITFNDNTQRTWNIARKYVYTYNNGIVMAIHGIGTNGNITNAAEWGVNRFAHLFTTSIAEPLVIRQDCDFRLTGGEIRHQGFATATVTFGLDKNGTPTSCPATGSYFYKLTWTGPNGGSISAILPY